MITNKKLVVYCLIALIIGAATIVPLGFFLVTQLDREPQFNLEVPYVYVDNYWDNDTVKIQRNYGWVYSVLFETTPKYNLRQFPFNMFPYAEAASEHYTIELLSEKGSIGNLSYSVSQYSQYAHRSGFHFDITVFHPISQSMGTAGNINGSSIGYINGPTKNLDTSIGRPDSLTLIVRREGWLIFKNTSTTIHLADSAIILQLDLEKYGDGFIYNKLFTEEQLSKMNPVMPQYEVL